MNKFASLNLTKRIEAKCDACGLTGTERDVFAFVARMQVGIQSIMRHFDDRDIGDTLRAMKSLMDAGLLHQMVSSDLYYTSAV